MEIIADEDALLGSGPRRYDTTQDGHTELEAPLPHLSGVRASPVGRHSLVPHPFKLLVVPALPDLIRLSSISVLTLTALLSVMGPARADTLASSSSTLFSTFAP